MTDTPFRLSEVQLALAKECVKANPYIQEIYDEWQASHPDLTEEEVLADLWLLWVL